MTVRGILLWLCGVTCFGGCTATPTVRLQSRTALPDRNVILFFVDGMDRGVVDELLAAGRLPGIQRQFVESGVAMDNVVVSMPAVTYPNSVSLLTGCFPGHHGVLGNTWFDRDQLELAEYLHIDSFFTVNDHIARPTIHEILHDELTVSVQFHTRRGVTRTFDHLIPAGLDWYLRNYSGVDRRVGQTFADVIRYADGQARWPTLTIFYFPGVDETAHRFGSNSERYAAALEVADQAVLKICDAVRDSHLADRTYLVLVTDHNHVQTPPHHHFDLAGWLQHRGLRLWQGRLRSRSRQRRLAALRACDAILVTGAGRCAVLHFSGNDWTVAPQPSVLRGLIEALIWEPAVALAATRLDPDTVQVYARSGTCRVQRHLRDGHPEYRVDAPLGDALGYVSGSQGAVLPGGGWHDSRTWLEHTIRTDYPDFVPQVVEMFDSVRAGDIVLFAGADWSFDGELSGHGSALARDMRVRMHFAGPDLAPGTRSEAVRLVDVMPTLLELLGYDDRLDDLEPIDGVGFAELLRRSASKR